MKSMRIIKIIEKSKLWLGIAAAILVICFGSLLIRGMNFGIDFVGGTIITIDLHTTFETDEIREIMDKYDNTADITYSGDAQEKVVISSKNSFDSEQREEIFKEFQDKYKLEDSDLLSIDNVTPTVGSEMTQKAILASLVAIAFMLIYITIRFEFYFGLAAIIALGFDIMIVIGVYSLLQIQVNSPFIAAILTILGYSINDTIVVFDRIRENETLIGLTDLELLTDTSISQTLTRSIYTSLTTLLAILALYIFGVDAIRDFALPLIVGIVSGAASSIFIAAPLWVFFQKKFPNSKLNVKKRKAESKRAKRKENIQI